jgi:hypothetical protein
MIGEPDAGKPQVRFDEGVQETCGNARACALLYGAPELWWTMMICTHDEAPFSNSTGGRYPRAECRRF